MKDMPPPKQWPSGDRFFLEDVLGPPDLVVRAKPFTMPAQSADIHFETEVPIPLTEPRWVRASETKPSLKGRRIAHHATTYLIRPQTPEAIAAERAVRAGQAGADVGDRRAPEHADGREGVLHRMGPGQGRGDLPGERRQARDAGHEGLLPDSLPCRGRGSHRHDGSGLVVPSERQDAEVQRGARDDRRRPCQRRSRFRPTR